MLPLWPALAVACAPGPTVAGTAPPEVDVCAPWDEVVPDDPEVRVVACDPRRIALRAPAGRTEPLTAAWSEATQAAGWREVLRNAAPGMVATSYDRGEGELVHLSVLDDAEYTQIVLVRAAAR